MTPRELPEDPSHWPADPYGLFGIQRNAPDKVLKRAYAELIRRFKPEQHPRQFQLIRTAYESIRSLHGHVQRSSDEDDPLQGFAEQPWKPDNQQPEDDAFSETLRSMLQDACSGNVERVYARLTEEVKSRPSAEAIYVRLFWLLTLFPELDHGPAAKWLTFGLGEAQTIFQLSDLCEIELRLVPEEALSDRFFDAIFAPARRAMICEFLQWRWEAAWVLERTTPTLCADLASCRWHFASALPATWTLVLFLAVDHLAWATDQRGRAELSRVLAEINQTLSLRTSQSHQLDRMDELLVVAKEWQQVVDVLGSSLELRKLIPAAWICRQTELAALIDRAVERLSSRSKASLIQLDELREKAPAVFWQYGRLLEQRSTEISSDEWPATDSSVHGAVGEFLNRSPRLSYPAWRTRLLEFLLEEFLIPAQFAEVLESDGFAAVGTKQLAAKVREDLPLAYVCTSNRLFWSRRRA
jgi:hypothetical protein